MITSKKTLPNSRVKLTITASAAQFEQAFNKELESVAKNIKIAGFRPGKAPRHKVIEQVGRQRIEAGALDQVVSDVYFVSLKEQDVVPVENPQIEITEYKAPAEDTKPDEMAVTFTAEVDVIPEVTIEGYKKIKVKKTEEPTIKEDEVERVIEYLRKQQASVKEVEAEATLKNGMWVDLAYEGSVGGVKRDDMKSPNHPMVMGEGQLIPGFEEEIVGMKAGETRTIHVTFPKDYHAKELAGKKAEFVVTINEMKDLVLPELNEEFAKGFGHDTMDQLLKAIKENLHQEKAEESKQKFEEKVLEELLKIAKFETPKSLVEQELERLFAEARQRLEGMQFQWDTYLKQTGKTVEQLKEEMRPQAERNVKIGLALGKIIQEEGIDDKKNAGRLAIDKLVEYATAK